MSDESTDAVAKALFAVKNPGRNWDTDIREETKDEFRELARAAMGAMPPPAPPEEKPAPPRKPLFGRHK